MKWQDSVVLISGASSGIGAELARQAVAKGSKVGLLGRNREGLEKLHAELGPRTCFAVGDVASYDETAAAVASVVAELGPIDILIANAGIGLFGAFLDAAVEDIAAQMQTNYMGVVHLLKAALPAMVSRRSGHVVTMGSIAGRIGSPFEAAYAASKFAGVGLTEAISIELSGFGIHTTTVNPGPVATPFAVRRGHPYDRARPKPVATSVVAAKTIRAVERNRSEIYIPGALQQAVKVRFVLPMLFTSGTKRAFAKELAVERGRPS